MPYNQNTGEWDWEDEEEEEETPQDNTNENTNDNTNTNTQTTTNQKKSESYSYVPEWYNTWLKEYWTNQENPSYAADWLKKLYTSYNPQDKYGQQTQNWLNTTENYNQNYYGNMLGLTEAQRQAQNQQYLTGIGDLQRYYQPAMEGMSRRGILNSSVTFIFLLLYK